MKKTLLLAGALLALTVSVASAAGGINLSWNDCGAAGVMTKTFACNSNNGVNNMVASAIAPAVMGQLNGQSSVFDLQTNQVALSPWWQFGGCRTAGSLSANFNTGAAGTSCSDPWQAAPSGGLTYAAGFGGPNKARIRTLCAISGNTPIDNVQEYSFLLITIGNGRSTGLGACAGCTDGACIVFNSILLTQPLGQGDYTISAPIERQHVQWQSGGGLGGLCPGATPTKSATWGSVKSLYR